MMAYRLTDFDYMLVFAWVLCAAACVYIIEDIFQ